ncbi:SLAM family member 9-like isoform X1 [Loxodonta africana]|uniref:SLAM family member 9-like isoform X1 n=1 Tax=Loxodonta africana TaxID=9785 RepID=UPI0030CDF04A
MGPQLSRWSICRASWLLGCISLLQGVWGTGAKGSGAHDSGTKDSGAHVLLKEIRGGSVLFHVIVKPEVNPGEEVQEIRWSFGSEPSYRVMLRVHNGADSPTWVSLQDKYKQRVHVPNMTMLRIENLTLEDSGQYRARVSLNEGREFIQMFHLIVYEPVPIPQILAKSSSTTPGWCNVTLECMATGATKNRHMTWESKGLPKNLNQREIPGPVINSWTLALSLPVSQHLSRPNANLTCVVSNSEDQKNTTLHVGEVCWPEENDQKGTRAQFLFTLLSMMLAKGLLLLALLGKLGVQVAKVKFPAEGRK